VQDGPEYTRLYKTGDIVRLLPDGNIDYIGRRDGMVKVRGFRIELSEVEGIIREFPGIKDATVKAFDEPAGGKSITAYVVSDSNVDFSELSAFITKSKPPYMVPAHFIQLDSIPMTVNGKVDKRKLPAPSSEPKRAGKEPSDPLERQLCEIYGEVLGLSKVYADDDFFAIGGTSISASKLVLNCMNAGIPVVYKNIFDNPSPEKLAKFIMTQGQGAVTEQRAALDESPLADNVEANLDKLRSHTPRRILLTGATGYLGSHILGELIRRNAKQIYCLVRGGKGQSAEDRLRVVFNYYFGGIISEEALKSVIVVDGDITDPDLLSKLEGIDFDTIINSAAVVKHFAADDSIDRVNVGGVENLIKVAQARDALLVQISTESVAGESVNGSIPEDRKLKESELDFGQNLDNKYAHSKFMAERAMIEAIPNGLKAKIIRVGNLMSRDSDGEFQINFNTNAFMKQMRSYVKLGFFPVTDMDVEVEFSPIDMVAKAVVILAGTPDEFNVFHVSNCHKVHMANVLKVMRDNGMPVEVVSRREFEARFMEALKDETKGEYVSGLISYMGNAGETRRFISADETYSIKALYRLGFSWTLISEQYIDKAFKSLASMRFFK
jgi:thioester reductase-like protein